MRGETIERVFADAKEKHGMRYTQYRGLRKVQHHLTLLFACMNLKKLAMWKRRQQKMPPAPHPVAAAATFFVSNLLFAIKNSFQSFSWKLFLSTVWSGNDRSFLCLYIKNKNLISCREQKI